MDEYDLYLEDEAVERAEDEKREAFRKELLQELAKDVDVELLRRRLQTAILRTPQRLIQVERLLERAAALSGSNHTDGAIVFACSATEAMVRDMIGRPVLEAAVVLPSIRDYLESQLLRRRVDIRRWSGPLWEHIAGVSVDSLLHRFAREGWWGEMDRLWKVRNDCVHDGAPVSADDARSALALGNDLAGEGVARLLVGAGIVRNTDGLLVTKQMQTGSK